MLRADSKVRHHLRVHIDWDLLIEKLLLTLELDLLISHGLGGSVGVVRLGCGN